MATAMWEPPGPGSWELDRSHYDSGVTPIGFEICRRGTEAAYSKGFAELGVPADGLSFRAVNGFAYARVRPLFGADKPSGAAPPEWLVKLLGRIHPEMRQREKRAAHQLANPRFREVLADWTTTIRPRIEARNLEFEAADVAALDDASLGEHVDALIAYTYEASELHHRLHLDDLGPLARYVVLCRDNGIEPTEALAALAGASPSTTKPRRDLAAIRAAIESVGAEPSTLDDVRSASTEAAERLDAYLERHGSILYSGYDLDTPTLGERPDVILKAILNASDPRVDTGADVLAGTLRERMEPDDHAEFDRVLADAREAMDMRDDNGPMTIEWPGGLLRLALLEVGRRLVDRGAASIADRVFELEPDEVSALISQRTGPSIDELDRRAAARQAQRSLDAPPYLGDPPEPPPVHLLPPAMATALDMVNAVMEAMLGSKDADRPTLTGSGIGDQTYAGVARVAESAEEAITAMEPGDVLVTRVTSPAFNLVMSIAGGLVTVHGGPMSHAAVLSRELGLPAVIGVEDCLEHIRTGDRIEVDPTNGRVTVVD